MSRTTIGPPAAHPPVAGPAPAMQLAPLFAADGASAAAHHAELLSLGAAGIVSKPFSPKDLPDQLRAIWAGLP